MDLKKTLMGEVYREREQRKRVYPKLITNGTLTDTRAKIQMDNMGTVYDLLERLTEEEIKLVLKRDLQKPVKQLELFK